MVIPAPSPRPACSNLRRRVSTWVSTERGAATEGRPGHAQQLLAAADQPRRHQECTKQSEFPRAEFHRLVSQGDLPQEEMHFEWAHRDPFLQTVMPRLSKVRQRAANSSRPNGFRRTSSAPSSSNPTTGSAPLRAVNTISWTTQLISETEGGNPCSRIQRDQKIRRLVPGKVQALRPPFDSCGEVTVAEPLNKDGTQGGMWLHDENSGWLLTGAGLGLGQRSALGALGSAVRSRGVEVTDLFNAPLR